MANLFPNAKLKFDTNAGAPLVGGTLTTYAAGTNTLQTTWQDSAGTIANANPIVLDARGECTAYGSGTYKFVLKDAVGTTIWTQDNVASIDTLRTDLAATGGSDLVGFIQAGTAPSASTVQAELRNIIKVTQFKVGGVVTVASFRNALAQLATLGGGVLDIPKGSYSLASVDLVATGLTIPANTIIRGNQSTITITGTSATAALFVATDVSNVAIEDLIAIGNSAATIYNDGAFLNYVLSVGAVTGVARVRVSNVEMRNFKANYWLFVNNANATYEIQHVRLENIRAISATGNSQAPADIAFNATAVMIYGSAGYVKDVVVDGIFVEATYIKAGCMFREKVLDGVIRQAVVLNAGLSGGADDSGSYAIACYNAGGGLGNITIESPTIHAPRDCGVYCANADRVTIINARINGQTSVADSVLPKGAIAINACTNVTILGGGLETNNVAVAVSAAITNIRISDLTTTGSVRFGLVIKPTGLLGIQLRINDSVFDSAGSYGGLFLNSATNSLGMAASNCDFIGRGASSYGLDFSGNGTIHAAPLNLSGGRCQGDTIGLRVLAGTGHIDIRHVELAGITNTVRLLDCKDATDCHRSGNHLISPCSAEAIDARGFIGSAIDETISGVATALVATSEGLVKPTFTGKQGWRIQNLAPAAATYSEWQWITATTWKGRGLLEA